jgi:hypothetical protein
VQSELPDDENQQVITIIDTNLLHGELMANRDVYQFRGSNIDLGYRFSTADVNVAVEQLFLANESVENLCADIRSHHFSLIQNDRLAYGGISLRNLNALTEQYGAQLANFEYNTDNAIGRIFRQYVDIDPSDDLVREYQFLGGMRKLVILKVGNYKLIDLPDELKCGSVRCQVGKINRLVERMNRLMVEIDWECIQIAHKMRDHQETTFPNGPYWVI